MNELALRALLKILPVNELNGDVYKCMHMKETIESEHQ